MNITLILFILHIVCAILWMVSAITVDKKALKISYGICAFIWGLCSVLDIVQMIG